MRHGIAGGASGKGRRRRPAPPIFAATIALLAAACQSVDRTVDFDPAADFAGYRTYMWAVAETAPSEAGVPPLNPLVHQRIEDAIERSLAAKGFTEGVPADFAVSYTVGVRDRTFLQPVGILDPGYSPYFNWRSPALTPRYVRRTYSEGTIAIDVFDVSTGRAVWHARASKPAEAEDADPRAIQAIVSSLLADFPPGAPPAAPPPVP